jgi:hypothetical protein
MENKIGWYYSFERDGNLCWFYGCNLPVTKGCFCDEHGKIEITGTIIHELSKPIMNINLGFKKIYK